MAGLPKKLIKKYGISKRAWEIYRGTKRVTKRVARPKRRKIKMAKRKRSYRPRFTRARARYHRAGGLKGMASGLFPDGILKTAVGAGALIAAQRYQPFGGQYKPAIDKIALGVILPVVGMGNKDFLSVGIKEGIATVVNGYLGGGAVTNGGAL